MTNCLFKGQRICRPLLEIQRGSFQNLMESEGHRSLAILVEGLLFNYFLPSPFFSLLAPWLYYHSSPVLIPKFEWNCMEYATNNSTFPYTGILPLALYSLLCYALH
ncbi:hypothetical protein KIL84_005282 [Mauremys mutica]|uniref:Uncharacterized protein n=1 Tax=Mauremys mutica TaxID=74926 RepID=A0A9D3XKN0_9SAUR|nr:hypothetical protein KIL84_005282 [Mauremys mutica]